MLQNLISRWKPVTLNVCALKKSQNSRRFWRFSKWPNSRGKFWRKCWKKKFEIYIKIVKIVQFSLVSPSSPSPPHLYHIICLLFSFCFLFLFQQLRFRNISSVCSAQVSHDPKKLVSLFVGTFCSVVSLVSTSSAANSSSTAPSCSLDGRYIQVELLTIVCLRDIVVACSLFA